MAWFADLSPCTYFGTSNGAFLRAVGWLARDHPFTTGTVNPRVLKRLAKDAENPWEPGVFCGPHRCDLCPPREPPLLASAGGKRTTWVARLRELFWPPRPSLEVRMWRNLFYPGDGFVYLCPEGIVHYIRAHGYRPPDEFCQAVLACPPMHSDAYLEAVLANGVSCWATRD